MLGNIIIDSDDIEAGVRFWSGALGSKVATWSYPYVFLDAVKSGGIGVGLQKVPEHKTTKSRVHLDFVIDDVEAEVKRLEELGAHRRNFVENWWVMEDPNRNEFCVCPTEERTFPDRAALWE